ncbi:YggT family protein [Frigoribacterium sp. CG_9.8]|uniref:YggT family protein n=1 Tax=Frigoribacterium sp. CG_9.8 TaxID=2787733 RepID=UPI001A27017E|nr:YggT family protein [Frigoribacterium sp. CG_9.8]
MILSPLAIPASIVYFLLLMYFFVLWGRFILDLVGNFSRGWRPHGFGLVVSEVVYALTDPPISLVRRIIPTIRIGGFALDFAWSIVMIVTLILLSVASAFRG